MVTRTRKLLGATLVLAVGLGLAWPFQRTEDASDDEVAPAEVAPSPAEPQGLSGPVELRPTPETVERPLVAAAVANISPLLPESDPPVEFHPRPAPPPAPPTVPVEYPTDDDLTTAEPSPVYAPLRPAAAQPTPPPTLRTHVVHNGDTLGRLAHRYLGNEDRALEIFDANRELLDNPHLLPIGAELKIPPR